MQDECLKNTGRTFDAGGMYAPSPRSRLTNGGAILSAEEIHANAILPPASHAQRVSAVTSSAWLMRFARALFSERIRVTSDGMLPGLGGGCEMGWNRLVTLSCPLGCERVALALSTNGRGCSCSPSLPTPIASDWRGGKRRRKKGSQVNLRDVYTQTTGWLYLPVEAMEAAMGFPITWTECEPSETPSSPKSQSGSDIKS
jgi:hypothetical protein